MFVSKKSNKTGVISVQVIDKCQGKYKVIETIGSSSDSIELKRMVKQGNRWILNYNGQQSFDLLDNRSVFFNTILKSV